MTNSPDPSGSAGLVRGFGLVQAVALNMSNMVGVGPFLTIPLIIGAMGGPQCMVGWLLGAALAICDGLVWSELAAAMPGTGGTYLYLSQVLRGTRLGGLVPFLFLWQFVLSGPLEIASGNIGFAQYVTYFWHGLPALQIRLIAMGAGALAVALLYRPVKQVGRLTVALWIGMMATVAWIIAGAAAHFNLRMAFDFPPGAFQFSRGFAGGLGSAMLIAMYDLMGYYDICYVGGEVREPARTIPRSILYSVAIVSVVYLLMNVGILAVVPWREAMHSQYIAATFIEKLYGPRAAGAATILVLWTAFASVFALLFGYSRILYAAASNGQFFGVFARLHPRGRFPHVALLVLGGLSVAACLGSLDAVISALLTSRILIQFLAQICLLDYIRRRRPDIPRPFRMALYPLPSLIAFAGWCYIFGASLWFYQLFAVVTLLVGAGVYWLWRQAAASPL